MNRCFANSRTFVPLGALTVRTSVHTYIAHNLLYIYIHTYIYIYILSQIGSYMNPCGSSSHMFMLLRVLTLRTSWYTCIYSEVYKYHIADAFVDEPMLKKLTYVYALASAHTYILLIYMHTLTSIHISYRRYVCRWTHVVQSHICVPLRVLTLRTSWCRCMFTSIHMSDHRHVLHMNPCCAKSHMCALASAQTKTLWPGHARTMGCDKSLPSDNLCVFFLHVYV